MTQFLGKKILIVDENREICSALEAQLRGLGYLVFCALTTEDIEKNLIEFKPDFLIIDKFLDGRGFSAITKVRSSEAFRTLPILFTAQSNDHSDKINALSLGADSFLEKPLLLEVLNMKIQALLRRAQSYRFSFDDLLYKNLKLSPLSGEVFLDSERVNFTATEYKLLEILVVEKGRPVRREALAHRSLNSINPNVRTIDVHIHSIRDKLGDIGRKIKTLRGKGYMLID